MIDTKNKLDVLRNEWNKGYKLEKARILICAGTGCVANGSLLIYEALKKAVEAKGNFVSVEMMLEDACSGTTVVKSGCHGFCEMGPLVKIEPRGILYTKVKIEDVTEIVEALVSGKGPVERLLYHHPITGEVFAEEANIPFYKYQNRNALANCGVIDPEEIREYISKGGYAALAKVLTELKPEEVCQEILRSGLRGRGGAGFPTGRKWDMTRIAKGDKKYVICNGDEGDPGAFMDRSVMEGDPFKVIEGMSIAAFAIGADEGYIYVRAEYPLAVQRLKLAVESDFFISRRVKVYCKYIRRIFYIIGRR
jgi:NADH-quinone oxidoreductase subunit F